MKKTILAALAVVALVLTVEAKSPCGCADCGGKCCPCDCSAECC